VSIRVCELSGAIEGHDAQNPGSAGGLPGLRRLLKVDKIFPVGN
jgi:hypothetical protein